MKTFKNITIAAVLFALPVIIAYMVLFFAKGKDYDSKLLDVVTMIWIVAIVLIGIAWLVIYRKDILNEYRNIIHSDSVKIELIKHTSDITGDVFYYVKANGTMQNDTWTKDESLAREHLKRITEKAKEHPKAIYETLETVNI